MSLRSVNTHRKGTTSSPCAPSSGAPPPTSSASLANSDMKSLSSLTTATWLTRSWLKSLIASTAIAMSAAFLVAARL